MINSQRVSLSDADVDSISKGMGDQFSACAVRIAESVQYIKGGSVIGCKQFFV